MEKCRECFSEIEISNNECHYIGDKIFCNDCFEQLNELIFWCDRCCKFDHKHNNFVKTTDTFNNDIYYHENCLFECEKCNICKGYLKSEKCVDVFIGHDCKNQYHKFCVENCDDYTICKDCNLSLRVKCLNCPHRFKNCYNDNCENYNMYEYEDPDRYNGVCRNCNY